MEGNWLEHGDCEPANQTECEANDASWKNNFMMIAQEHTEKFAEETQSRAARRCTGRPQPGAG